MKVIEGTLNLSKCDGIEIYPGIFLIGEPTPRPDIGPNKMVSLANYNGSLITVILEVILKNEEK